MHHSRDAGTAPRSGARIALLTACTVLAVAALPVGGAHAQESLDVPVRTTREAPPEPTERPPAADEPGTEGGAATGSTGAAPVELDQLLRLPNSLDFKEERRGGGGAADWRRRFAESERSVRDAEAKLEQVETELAEAGTSGGGQWQIAPPGQQSSSETGPLSFKLREELRRAREALEEAERKHRALVVEADLAQVPEDWRRTSVR